MDTLDENQVGQDIRDENQLGQVIVWERVESVSVGRSSGGA